MTKVAINGFGRIGRLVARAILERGGNDLDLVAINDLADAKSNAWLFSRDSIHGKYPGTVAAEGQDLVVDGKRYSVPGDFAQVEADGSITLLGRGSVCINTGGEKVFPEEVEEVLKLHPAIADAVAVGLPDEKFGEAITGVVELVPDAELDVDRLERELTTLLADPGRLAEMAAATRRAATVDAAERVAAVVEAAARG